ncbi:MAG: hypothetical protein U0W40_03160 [Acidimicrobiia bacterium]
MANFKVLRAPRLSTRHSSTHGQGQRDELRDWRASTELVETQQGQGATA